MSNKRQQVFKSGDRVRVVHWGAGVGSNDLGRIVTISCRGKNYMSGVFGYCIEEKIGNGTRGRVIGAHTFELVEPTISYPNPPHRHAELIKAWADGAEIQLGYLSGKPWCDVEPDWSGESYRIKPTKSQKDLKIEVLEAQAQQLAKDIAKLKES